MSDRSRCQSEVVGIVLLTAVIVVVVAVAGAFVLSSFESDSESDPRVTVESEINETILVLKHNGGDSFEAASVEVVLRAETETRDRLSAGTFIAGTDRTVFEPGDVWRYTHGFSAGEVRLRVFDQQSANLIHEAVLEINTD